MNAMVWKRCCAWLLCAAMALGILPGAGWAMESDEREKNYYCDEYGERHDLLDTVLVEDETWANNWYIVKEMVTLDKRVEVEGDVYLVLSDGATLTAPRGIHVAEGNSLTVYGQEQGNGKLIAQGDEFEAGIGGNQNEHGGSFIFNGGDVHTTGGKYAAGIGGGSGGVGTKKHIIINSGVVTAKGGSSAAGIGGGSFRAGTMSDGKIIINGGSVFASSVNYGAGIGGGQEGSSENIEIHGGYIESRGENGSAGIGAGSGSNNGGNIFISGGTIYAYGSVLSSVGSAGIGGGHLGSAETITITGGEIHATGGAGDLPGDGIGNGGGYSGDNEQTSISISDVNECPVIYTSFIADVDTSAWKGIIFQEDKGQV